MAQLSKMLADMIENASFNEYFKNRLRDLHIYSYKSYYDVRVEDKSKKNKTIPKNTLSDSISRLESILQAYFPQTDNKDTNDIEENSDMNAVMLKDTDSNPFFALYRYCFQNSDFAAFYIALMLILSDKVTVKTDELIDFIGEYVENSGFAPEMYGEIISDAIDEAIKAGNRTVKTELILLTAKGQTIDKNLNIIKSDKFPTQKQLGYMIFACGFVKYADNDKKFEKISRAGYISQSSVGRNKIWKASSPSLFDTINKAACSYDEKQCEFFICRLRELLEYFASVFPLGEIGSKLAERVSMKSPLIVKNKSEYIKRAICDYNIIDLLYAIKNNKWVYITYRNAIDQEHQSILAYPIELRESTRDGRQYIAYYSPHKRSVSCLRVESVDKLSVGDYTCDYAAEDIENAKVACEFAWGNSFPRFMNENAKDYIKTYNVFLRIRKDDLNACTILKTHYRHGIIEERDEYLEYNVQVLSINELKPWLRMLYSGIVTYEVDGIDMLYELIKDAELSKMLYANADLKSTDERKNGDLQICITVKQNTYAEKYFSARSRWIKNADGDFVRKGSNDAVRREVADYLSEYGSKDISIIKEVADNTCIYTPSQWRALEAERDYDFLYVDVDIIVESDSLADRMFSEVTTLLHKASDDYVRFTGVMEYGRLLINVMRFGKHIKSLTVNGRVMTVDMTNEVDDKDKNIMSDEMPNGFSPCVMHELLFNEFDGIGYTCMEQMAFELLNGNSFAGKHSTNKKDIDSIFDEMRLVDTSNDYHMDKTDYDIMCRAVDVLNSYGVDTVSPRAKRTLGKTLKDISDFIKALGNYDPQMCEFNRTLKMNEACGSFNDILPLSNIEREWLYDVLSDKRADMFLSRDEINIIKTDLNVTEKTFDSSAIKFYDKRNDPLGIHEKNILKSIIHAVFFGKCIRVSVSRGEGSVVYNIAPCEVEYNRNSEGFTLCGVELGNKLEYPSQADLILLKEAAYEWLKKYFIRIDVSDIIELHISDVEFIRNDFLRLISSCRELVKYRIVLKFKDTRNTPDRILTELSPWKKSCKRNKHGMASIYTLELYYNEDDTELLKNILVSYGAYVYIESDSGSVRNTILNGVNGFDKKRRI